MKKIILIIFLFSAQTAYAQVVINEIQIAPIQERFIELYNSSDSDVDLTDWYIQRKTATGGSFGSLITSTQLSGKTIKAHGYFLVSRSQLENSDVVAGNLVLTESNTIRIRNSKGKDVDQIEWGSINEGKSYQRTSVSEWATAAPTPGAANVAAQETSIAPASQPSNAQSGVSSFPVEPQIIADAGASTRAVSAGATVTFSGRVFGLKKEPIENARLVWSFGDGALGEGMSVNHTYYYPGEYTVVLDASSGYYSASDRVAVRVSAPVISISTGGDTARSFVAIENHGSEELDLSFWQIESLGKRFIIPKNTFAPARKTLMIASEYSGLSTPLGSTAFLNFPNGSRVETKTKLVVQETSVPSTSLQDPTLRTRAQGRALVSNQKLAQAPQHQEARVVDAFASSTPLLPREEDAMWPWYIGVAFLGALALLGLRLAQEKETKNTITAEDFEIIEDEEPY